jgi:hypothetical protein
MGSYLLELIIQLGISLIPVAVVIIPIYGFVFLVKKVYKHHWHVNLDYDLQFSSKSAFEKERIIITDIITNRNRLPLPWIHMSYKKSPNLAYPKDSQREPDEEQWDDSDYVDEVVYRDDYSRELDYNERYSFVYFVASKKTVSRKSEVLCKKRGLYHITDVAIRSNNPLMTGFAIKTFAKTYAITVFPRLIEYSEAVFPFKRLLGDVSVRRFIDPDPFSFKGIREYQPYDNFKQINFNATAKTGELMSNIYDFTISGEITILLNLQNYDIKYNRDYVHEMSIRLTAFLSKRFTELGIPVSLVYPLRDGTPKRIKSGLSGTHLYTIYTALAHIDLTAGIASVSEYMTTNRDITYILISSYHGPDIKNKFIQNQQKNPGNRWVVPYFFGDRLDITESDSIITWEVPHADK